MKAQILTDFSGWRDADLDQDAHIIAGAMKNNPHFPMLADAAAAVDNAAEAFHVALLAAARGNGEAHSNKDDKRAILIKAIRYLGGRINLEANGNRTLLESTGFPLGKAVASGRKGKEAIKLAAGPGSVTVMIKKVRGAGSYIIRYTEAPVSAGSVWQEAFATHTTLEVSGLKADRKYAFRIAPVFHGQTPVFSEPVIS